MFYRCAHTNYTFRHGVRIMKKLSGFLSAVVFVFVAVGLANAWTQLNDGGVHNIDYIISDDVWVDFGVSGMGTTVNFLSGGGVASGYELQGHEDCLINIVGGTIGNDFHLYNRSQSSISSGSVADELYCYDNSQMVVYGGYLSDLRSYDNSQMTVSGGDIAYLRSYNNSQVTVSDGDIYRLYTYDNSQITMSGGIIDDIIFLAQSGILTVHGSDFHVDGTPTGYGELTSILGGSYNDEPSRTLSGTLASGEAINNVFYIGYSAKIILAPIPTPPIANAGQDQIIFSEIVLNASQSSDPGGTIEFYEWYIQHRDNSAYNKTAEGMAPTITDLEPGFYDATLTVTDNDGETDTDVMMFSAIGCKGDFNGDGNVDGSDLAEFTANFGRTDCPSCD
jgi:hypothetical protein